MTNEEAKAFLDNLKICINEHPIVADWLVEIANRKTEPQKIGYCNECKWFRDRQVCGRCRSKNLYAPKDEPQTEADWKDRMWAEAIVTEPTISKMEQVDKDINVRSKECDTCKWGEWYRKGYDITMMSDECGGCCSWNNKWKPKDEPQTDCPWK